MKKEKKEKKEIGLGLGLGLGSSDRRRDRDSGRTGVRGRLLIVAGSDSGGGAGIQADIKTACALGCYAATAITAVTVQNTRGVSAVHEVPAPIVAQQIEAVLEDIGADAVKTGMLGGEAVVLATVRALQGRSMPVVVDPVMVAKGGAALLAPEAAAAVRDALLPLAALVTPNVPEAEALTGLEVRDLGGMRRAAAALLELGAKAALVKGGHLLASGPVVDLLADRAGELVLEAPRIDTRSTHGTGCTLASAIAASLAQGMELRSAVQRAHRYVQAAIAAAPGFGSGHGPLDHLHAIEPWIG